MIEHRVGVHDVSWSPKSTSMSPEQISGLVRNSDADFFVHIPGWREILLNKDSYGRLSSEMRYVDDSWHIDRAVEIVTPLPNSVRLIPKNITISMAYPIFPLSKILTSRSLDTNPDSSLIRRWPVFESDDSNQRKRNKIIELMSPKVDGFREVLDVHSLNIGLTAEQILEWKEQKQGRRLMISALMIDERLEKYGLALNKQQKLINPLISHVSAINLKVGPLKNGEGIELMSEDEVIDAILKGNKDNFYAYRLKQLSEKVGDEAGTERIDWIIKVKSKKIVGSTGKKYGTDEFLHAYVDFLKKVLQ